MKNHFFIVIIAKVFYDVLATFKSKHHLLHPAIDPHGLSITGFALHMNNNNSHPDWVNNILGKKAVFFNKTDDIYGLIRKSHDPLVKPFKGRKYYPIPESDINAINQAHYNYVIGSNGIDKAVLYEEECSIEMIGFVRLSSSWGKQWRFNGLIDRLRHPTVGTFFIQPHHKHQYHSNRFQSIWKCYYRGLYSNRRVADVDDTFWTVVIYCPIREHDACHQINSLYDTKKLVQWELILDTNQHSAPNILLETYRETENIQTISQHPPLAICTVWPYISNIETKRQINKAIIFEFMRYYSSLSIKMIIFDRDGANLQGLFQSKYFMSHDINNHNFWQQHIEYHLVYHNYTIHSLLQDHKINNQQWIMNDMEGSTMTDRMLVNNDRSLTYSQCRFEAATYYGIDRVIVADFDEFLFCRTAHRINNDTQRKYIDHLLSRHLQQYDMDQMKFGYTSLRVKDRSQPIHDCLLDVINNPKQSSTELGMEVKLIKDQKLRYQNQPRSIFECFPSIHHIDNSNNIKSVHLKRTCPFTSIHHACSPNPRDISAYDCLCKSSRKMPQCDFIHLSMVPKRYKYFYNNDSSDLRQSCNELIDIINPSR